MSNVVRDSPVVDEREDDRHQERQVSVYESRITKGASKNIGRPVVDGLPENDAHNRQLEAYGDGEGRKACDEQTPLPPAVGLKALMDTDKAHDQDYRKFEKESPVSVSAKPKRPVRRLNVQHCANQHVSQRVLLGQAVGS